MRNKIFLNFCFLVLMAAVMSMTINVTAQAAQSVPDAGQFSQELKKQPNLNQPSNVELLKPQTEMQDQSAETDDVRILVNGVKVTGSQLFDHALLESLATDLIGGQHNFAEIDAAVSRITHYYRERGYLVARAYLPVQDLKDGIIEINVLEGRLGEHRIQNEAHVADSLINSHLDHVKTNSALQSEKVDRAVLLVGDLPGVGGARASLQPGASVGTSDLIVEVAPGQRYSADVEIDNYGSYYTGLNRLGGAVALNSPLKLGDQLTVRALTSDQDMKYGRISYQLPIGSNGIKLGLAYSDMSYTLGKQYSANDFHGTASSSSVFVTYPFMRGQLANLYGTITYEQKDLHDINADTIDKKVRLVNLGFTGNRQDAFLGGGYNSIETSLVVGDLTMDSTTLSQDQGGAKTKGTFEKLNVNLSRLQRLTDRDTLSLALSFQQANKNLNSSEKFYLGGVNGVRAMPQSEAGGDEGWMINAEVRHDFTELLQGVAFFDTGTVHINHNAYIADAANVRNVSGVGFGINAHYKALQFKSALAYRTNGGTALSEPASSDIHLRLWVQVGGAF